MSQKSKILVAVFNTGSIRIELSAFLIHLSHDDRYLVKIIFPNNKPYEHSINLTIRDEFLKGDYDYFLMIDHDNPPLKNPLDLVDLDKDVIACPTPQWNMKDPNFPIYWVAVTKDGEEYREYKNKEGLQEVDAVGSGCLLIARRVLKKVKCPFVRIWNEDGVVTKGVDFNFCEKAKNEGFKIYTHYDYPCSHFKELNLIDVLNFKLND